MSARGPRPGPEVPETPALAQLRRGLRRLYRDAGEPSLRDLARLGKGTFSRGTAGSVLKCASRPRWRSLEAVVRALAGDVEEFHRLWVAAGEEIDQMVPLRGRPATPEGEARQLQIRRFLTGQAERFLGRGGELTWITDALRDIPDAGRTLVVEGPPGIGKTWLVGLAADLANHLDYRVAHGCATELDRISPLSTFLSALSSLPPHTIAFDLAPRSTDRFQWIDWLGRGLERAAARRPLVVIIDDAQWTDEFSSLALRNLVPKLARSPVMWLFARRSSTARSPGQNAIDRLLQNGAARVSLAPLGPEPVRRLCCRILDAPIDDAVMDLAARARGNPFDLEQLLRALKRSGQIDTIDGVVRVVDGSLPTDFSSAVADRLNSLSAGGRALVAAAAIIGRPFSLREASALQDGTDAGPPRAGLDEAVAAGIVAAIRNESLVLRHDLFREAAYTQIPGDRKAAMHMAAAMMIRARAGSAGEVAEHILRSGQPADHDAVDTLLTAAAHLAERAPGTAADLILRGMQVVDRSSDDWSLLSTQAVRLLAVSGENAIAQEIADAALLGGLDSAAEATTLLDLAEAFKHAGQNAEAVRYARRALTRPAVPDRLQARLQATMAHALLWESDVTSADQAGAAAVQIGRMSQECAAVVVGATARSVVARIEGRLVDALTHAESAVAETDRSCGQAASRHPRIWLGAALSALDRLPEALRTYAVGRQEALRLEALRLDSKWSLPLWDFYHASALLTVGDLDGAESVATTGLDAVAGLISTQMSVPLLGLLTRIAVLRGDQSSALDYLRQMPAVMEDGLTAAPEDLAWASALCHEAERAPEVALSAAACLYDRLPNRLLIFTTDAGSMAGLVRIALAAGDRRRATAAAEAAQVLADRNPDVAYLRAAAAQARGLLNDGVADLRLAVRHFENSPRRLDRARATEDCALLEAKSGRPRRAVDLLHEAAAEYRSCGAYLPLRRCGQALITLRFGPGE